jgi:hypothetical protein
VGVKKEQQIKASLKTFFAVFDRQSIASIAVFGCVEDMRTKRLLRVWKRVISVISIALPFALPCPAPPCWFDRSAKSLSVIPTVNCRRQSLSASPGAYL